MIKLALILLALWNFYLHVKINKLSLKNLHVQHESQSVNGNEPKRKKCIKCGEKLDKHEEESNRCDACWLSA
jgi:hypothetical protein